MVQRHVATVAEYLKLLSPSERAELSKVRKVIKANLPKGFVEAIDWGMICYEVPLKTSANTYNGKPLCYAGLAAQKHKLSVYLSAIFFHPKMLASMKKAFKDAGKTPDMGKCCIRFKKADDLPLAIIGNMIASTSVPEFVETYDELRASAHGRKG